MYRTPLTCLPFRAVVLLLATASAFAQSVRDHAVEINATVQEVPPAITLQWTPANYTVTQQTIYRRLKDGPTWVQWATPANSATSYADHTVAAGVSYEYRISRTISAGSVTAEGYISAGIRVPLVTDRGRVILLVDDTMAAPLAGELAQFVSDLTGDGWSVVRQDVSRTAAVAGVRAAIQSIYQADPANTKSLILFGHIPVPYSGDIAIDGHPDHYGAWPTDVFYGDMDGDWTDSFVDDSRASLDRNRNIRGDGKFDQTVIPSDIELQVGRIDLTDMPAFNASETELLRRYLNRDHQYRQKLGDYASIGALGLIDDNFPQLANEAFAVTGWRGFTACVGLGNVQELDWFSTLQDSSYLWAYGCGPGSYTSADGIGTTTDFATRNSRAVFTVSFGSYFGDWDISNSFLRAPLCERTPQSGETVASLGLISAWSGRPHWVFHPMSLGETAGYCARLTQNNRNGSGGYDSNVGERFNHIALLGDPTLRLYPVAPPTNLAATAAAQAITLDWTAPAGVAIEGYMLARATSPAGPFVRLRGTLVNGTSYVDRSVAPGASYAYMVRAVKLETSPTGTYFNPSQGLFSAAVTAAAASGPELEIAGNGNAISAGDTTPLTTNGTDFGSAEVLASTTRTFVLTNAGSAPLHFSGAFIGGANANDFAIVTAPPAALAPSASASVAIQFHPTVTGSRAAICTISSDDADEASYSFAITGTGVPSHAEIAIYPPSINRSIHSGDAAAETLTISNPGPGTLVHTITSSLSRYSARDSDSFAGPTFQWTDISTTGTEITGWANLDDATSGQIDLGFNFPFYGSLFGNVLVCTNGYLSFTDTVARALNSNVPSSSAAANLIAPLWSDLILDGSSHVYWQKNTGEFVVQFENVAFFNQPGTRVTFQVILRLSGEIFFEYKTLAQLGTNYTVGLQNSTRDDGLLVAYNSAYLHPGLAIRIRPPGLETWLNLDASAGTIAPGGSRSITATLNTDRLALGNYYAELSVASNAANTPTIVLPVRLTVGNTPVEDWRLAHFGTTANAGDGDDTANLDGDSRNNLLEYALASEPLITDTPGAPVVSTNAAGYLQIQFTRHTGRTDLRYLIEATSDLTGSWTLIANSIHGAPTIATGAHSSVENGASEIKTVTVEDTAPTANFTSRFLRLRVVRD